MDPHKGLLWEDSNLVLVLYFRAKLGAYPYNGVSFLYCSPRGQIPNVFFPCRPYQPCLMFTSKVGA